MGEFVGQEANEIERHEPIAEVSEGLVDEVDIGPDRVCGGVELGRALLNSHDATRPDGGKKLIGQVFESPFENEELLRIGTGPRAEYLDARNRPAPIDRVRFGNVEGLQGSWRRTLLGGRLERYGAPGEPKSNGDQPYLQATGMGHCRD